MNRYIFNEAGEPVQEPDTDKWGKWWEVTDSGVAKEKIRNVLVSTIFLGLDHSFDSGDPILWETMVFGGAHDRYQERCGGTRADALAMHKRVVAMVEAGASS